jgi:hypothetical protein
VIELSAEIEKLNHVQGNHVHSFYIHNIHEWTIFFYFVSCYYVDLDRNGRAIN